MGSDWSENPTNAIATELSKDRPLFAVRLGVAASAGNRTRDIRGVGHSGVGGVFRAAKSPHCSSSLLIGAETKGSCGPATKKKVRSTRARQCRPSRRLRAR